MYVMPTFICHFWSFVRHAYICFHVRLVVMRAGSRKYRRCRRWQGPAMRIPGRMNVHGHRSCDKDYELPHKAVGESARCHSNL